MVRGRSVSEPVSVVITGSTRGIGLGLAREFLGCGHGVMISGRRQADCDAVAAKLRATYPDAPVEAKACDVTQIDSLHALWDAAAAALERLDHPQPANGEYG